VGREGETGRRGEGEIAKHSDAIPRSGTKRRRDEGTMKLRKGESLQSEPSRRRAQRLRRT